MRYDNNQLRDALAAEYALGTLRGAARRRFERIAQRRPDWREEAERISLRLAPLAETVAPAEPPPVVWERIESRLDSGALRSAGVGWWRSLALFSTAAAIVLAIALAMRTPEPAVPLQLAVLADVHARTGWVVAVEDTRDGPVLRASAVEAPAAPGKAYELWMLPGGSAAPVSLGLLPASGTASRKLPGRQREVLQKAAGLAVSVEPSGGSPTGRPTGPVLFQGRLQVF